jgi:hypothetical protein
MQMKLLPFEMWQQHQNEASHFDLRYLKGTLQAVKFRLFKNAILQVVLKMQVIIVPDIILITAVIFRFGRYVHEYRPI